MVGEFLNKLSGSVEGEDALTVTWGNDYNTGVSFVVPATRIREILDLPEAQNDRERQLAIILKQKQQLK